MQIVAGKDLKTIIERLENLEESKKDIQDEIRDVLAESKSKGLDPKIIKLLMKERAQDKAKLEEEQSLLDTYRHALERDK